jgi:hypothetical protein
MPQNTITFVGPVMRVPQFNKRPKWGFTIIQSPGVPLNLEYDNEVLARAASKTMAQGYNVFMVPTWKLFVGIRLALTQQVVVGLPEEANAVE